MGIPDHLACLLRNLYSQSSQEVTEHYTEQGTGSKLGKEYEKGVYCHPAYLTYMHSTSCEMLGWMNYKLESRFPGEISTSSDMQMTPPLWQKAKKNFMKVKEKSEKTGLKLNMPKTKIMVSNPIT